MIYDPTALTDIELLIDLTSLPRECAVALLDSAGGWRRLAALAASEVAATYGIPTRAAKQIALAGEVARRIFTSPWPETEALPTAEAVWDHFRGRLGLLTHETLIAIGLDSELRRVCEVTVADGSIARAIVDPRDVFIPLLRSGAVFCILVHNHPSGNPEPSADDRRLTDRLVAAGQLVGVKVVDHVIITATAFHSIIQDGPLVS